MVTIDQAMRGAAKFADNEIIPHLPTGKGIGAGIALALSWTAARRSCSSCVKIRRCR